MMSRPSINAVESASAATARYLEKMEGAPPSRRSPSVGSAAHKDLPTLVPGCEPDDLVQRHAASEERRSPKRDLLSLPASYGVPTLDSVPVLLVRPEEIDTLDLDPRARPLLTLVNEKATVEEILLSAGVFIVEGITMFEGLAESGIVAFA